MPTLLGQSRKLKELERAILTYRPVVAAQQFPTFSAFFHSVFAEYLTDDPADLHQEMLNELDVFHLTRGQKKVRLAPRGFAKTVLMQAYVLYCAGYALEPLIFWLSNTKEQSYDNLTILKGIIETNEAFAKLCPQAAGPGPIWRQGRIVLRNGVRIDAYGALQNIRGRRKGKSRPSLIIGDDLQKTEQMESGALRRRTLNWWNRDVLYVGSPETNYYVTDTAIHPEAISYVLATKTPGWDAKVYRALVQWPERMDLWASWKNILLDHTKDNDARQDEARMFYLEHSTEMDAGNKVLWKARFPLYQLMGKWAESGPAAFNSEFQNDPQDPALCLWPSECFDHDALWFDEWPNNLVFKTVGVDASLGKHDYSACVYAGLDVHGVWWIDADLEVDDPRSMCVRLVEWCKRWQPHGIHVESLAFQQLIRPDLEAEMVRQSCAFEVHEDLDTTNKLVRIRRMSTYIVQRRIRLKRRSKGAILLLEQLRYFPTHEFDDGGDALEKSMRLVEKLLG